MEWLQNFYLGTAFPLSQYHSGRRKSIG